MLRAQHVPLLHDEIRTLREYVNNGNLWPPHAAWDAGNHVLVSLVAAATHRLFGDADLSLRMFSVVMLVVYVAAVHGAASWVKDVRVRVALWSALLCTPFLIEFFSLCRGYGPGISFQMMALVWVVRSFSKGSWQAPLLAMLLGAFASYACLTLLPVTCGIFAFTLLSVLLRPKTSVRAHWVSLVGIGILGVLLLWPSIAYAQALSERGLLYAGGHTGLVKDTSASLAYWVLGLGGDRWPIFFAVLALLLIVGGLWPLLRHRPQAWSDPRVVLAGIFGMEILGRWLLGSTLDMAYPTDRTALHFVPYMIILAALVIDRIAELQLSKTGSSWSAWAAAVLLLLPLRTIAEANTVRTTFWVRELIPEEVLDAAKTAESRVEAPLSIGGPYHLSECWDRAREKRKEPVLHFEMDGYSHAPCDLLVMDTLLNARPAGYHLLASGAGNDIVLFERDLPLRKVLMRDTSFAVRMTSDEFVGLWEPVLDSLLLNTSLLIATEVVLRSDERTIPLALVFDTERSKGEKTHYGGTDMHHLRNDWAPDTLQVVKRMAPLGADVDRMKMFFYNARHRNYAAPYVRVRVYGVTDDVRP
ncbi:MAG: hypothetical protein JNM62_06850 [Flavobacteriales bacterium]|nr:hypothetical protein [Flavobacteriales bacterium]